jgi:NodT family efflux transporter outer membrane factor (OMF) lipoprotein
MPDQWHHQLTQGFVITEPMPARWWELLDDPILNELVEQVRVSNPDLQSAYWSLVQARFARDYAVGDHYPWVDTSGGYRRTRLSENSYSGGGFATDSFDAYSAGFDASWEPDIFGRISRAIESAQASYEAQIENYRDVRVTLSAEAARNYVELRTVQAQLQYTLQNLQTQQDTLNLAQARFESELAPRLDVEQARLNLADTQSQIPLLRSAEKAIINRLCILTGRHPGALYDKLAEATPVPVPPSQIGIQVPVELLRRRPDIRRAERQLAAQSARIGTATAELYPHFSLTGSIGFEAMNFSNLLESSSRHYSFGPSFRWNLFSGGRIRSLIRIEESATEQLYWQYQSTVLSALEEVENAMTDYIQQQLRRQALQESVEAARQSVELVTAQYKNGLTDFQSVLVLQRSLLQQEDKLAQSEGQVVQNVIRIYKALGGWTDDSLRPSVSVGQDEQAVN